MTAPDPTLSVKTVFDLPVTGSWVEKNLTATGGGNYEVVRYDEEHDIAFCLVEGSTLDSNDDAVGSDRIYLVSLSDPSNPSILGYLDADTADMSARFHHTLGFAVDTTREYLYVPVAERRGDPETVTDPHIAIWKYSDPANPSFVADLQLTGDDGRPTTAVYWEAEQQVFFTTPTVLFSVDVSTPSSPNQQDSIGLVSFDSPTEISIEEQTKTLWIAHSTVQWFDISDPTSLVQGESGGFGSDPTRAIEVQSEYLANGNNYAIYPGVGDLDFDNDDENLVGWVNIDDSLANDRIEADYFSDEDPIERADYRPRVVADCQRSLVWWKDDFYLNEYDYSEFSAKEKDLRRDTKADGVTNTIMDLIGVRGNAIIGVLGFAELVVYDTGLTEIPDSPVVTLNNVQSDEVTLNGTPYSHPTGVAHQDTRWLVRDASVNNWDPANMLYDSGFVNDLEQHTATGLPATTDIEARAIYRDANGGESTANCSWYPRTTTTLALPAYLTTSWTDCESPPATDWSDC